MELPPLRDLGGINPFTPPEYATVYIYIYIYTYIIAGKKMAYWQLVVVV